MAYDNEMRGVLFKNNKKNTEKHPDYNGTIQINGVEYWLAAWIRTPKPGGQKFMALRVNPKDEQQQAPASSAPVDPAYVEDDIPF
jgi:uncharacterized protein (DUF736 family)